MSTPLVSKFGAPPLLDALTVMANAYGLADARFPARNFLLECEVPDGRVRPYLDLAGKMDATATPATIVSDFQSVHNVHVQRNVEVGLRSSSFDEDSHLTAEPFRSGRRTVEFGGAAPELLLVRVEHVDFIARSAVSWTPQEVRDLFEQVAQKCRVGDGIPRALKEEASAVLDLWQESIDARPLFSAFWDDASEIEDWSIPGWANVVRDRAGLSHYNPDGRGESTLVLFRYRVDAVPKTRAGDRVIVRPTVLDGRLSAAFFTAEPFSGAGNAVDLEIRDEPAWVEVIHPPFHLTPEHIWAVDVVTKPLVSPIAAARAQHSMKTQIFSSNDFAGLCERVEGDDS